jgi:hypothetical protein
LAAGAIFVQIGTFYKREKLLRWKERITKSEEDIVSSKTKEHMKKRRSL